MEPLQIQTPLAKIKIEIDFFNPDPLQANARLLEKKPTNTTGHTASSPESNGSQEGPTDTTGDPKTNGTMTVSGEAKN